MSCVPEVDFNKIIYCYHDLGEKKLLKKSLSGLNINKKVFLFYARNSHVPICALPKFRLVLSSRSGFLSFCCNFFHFMSCYRYPIPISKTNIASIAKFVLSHEVGHILDPDVYASKEEYADILTNIVEKLIKYDIDIEKADFYKKNLPSDLEECVVLLKKNLIYRESKAWDIAKNIVIFNNDEDRYLFERIREYALATYNFGNLKNIIKEHNIENILKYRKYFIN
ncbi:hypothetical protein [Romboutsia timonensis]|uniref:hypothetical protein n=1 Tax=Romboutsia timonensis TaxID=1776391 RepID=UPI002A8068D4|nr:hypothetical protein [Romboutsia timonensis]MDY3960330.1 hypothetical protein [Romboutsia timonensis]